MNEELPSFVVGFNEIIEKIMPFLFIARDSALQRTAYETLKKVSPDITKEKAMAISRNHDDYANILLGCEYVALAASAELMMWLLLKDEMPEKAWDELVTAQMMYASAIRAHEHFVHLQYHCRRLEAIERIIFPPQIFVSSGLIVKRLECSICRKEYEDCEHLVGKPYMGSFCQIIAHDVDIDHVAIVEHPADKRCRIQYFSVEGGKRNRMTWKIEEEREIGAISSPDLSAPKV